jgi:hypothetical protein
MMPESFTAAGSDADLLAAHRRQEIESRATRAVEHLTAAQVALSRKTPGSEGAEREARTALAFFERSLDWAEDTELEAEVHQRMDDAGRWVCSTFGCHLDWDGTAYYETCPVAIAHNRLGLSIGGAARRICSLCGDDLSECEHQRGTAYMVPGGHVDLGWCRVCLSKEACDHDPNELFRVSVVSIITEMDIEEVSIVNKPAQPEARFTRVSIPLADLKEALGPEFEPGIPVNCDKCLLDCAGLRKHPDMLPQGISE